MAGSAPTTRHLLLDEPSLARQARTVLAAADDAVLVLGAPRAGRTAGYRLALHDDEGEPVLVAPRDAAVDRAALRRAPAALVVRPRSPDLVDLQLTGRLAALPRPTGCGNAHCTGRCGRLALSALRVERISVGCPHRGPGPVGIAASREISLAEYGAARPDAVLAAAPRMLAHLRDAHADRLRGAAARIAGADLDAVAAADVLDADRHGVRLTWVDATGGHLRHLGFGRTVDSAPDLADALRSALDPGPEPPSERHP